MISRAHPEKDGCGEIFGIGYVGPDVRALDDVLFTVEGFYQRETETRAGVGHRERRRAGSGFGLDHLGAGLLNPLGQSLELVVREGNGGFRLRDQRNYRYSAVAADYGNGDLQRVQTLIYRRKEIIRLHFHIGISVSHSKHFEINIGNFRQCQKSWIVSIRCNGSFLLTVNNNNKLD